MDSTHPTIDDVAGELLREEHRLTELEDRLRRLELETTAGEVARVAIALQRTRSMLGSLRVSACA
jgi:hypothetical protein